MNMTIGAVSFLFIFGLAEALQRWLRIRQEVTRKVAHTCAGIAVVVLARVLSAWEIMVLAVVFAAFLALSKSWGLLPSIHAVGRKTWGEVYYPLGIGLTAFCVLPGGLRAFQFGVLVLALADSLAGIVGDAAGKHRIALVGNRKSLEGSAAFFFAAFVTLLAFQGWRGEFVLVSMTVALFLTLVELFLLAGLDNLLLPVCASYLFKAFAL